MDEVVLRFEYGRTWTLAELGERSIALDGAVRGPAIDAEGQRYSFDHHDGCLRHATLSCCEQVLDGLRVGLEPRGFTVYVNDVDADSALGAWLLRHSDRVATDDGRIEALVRSVGRLDALGPAAGVDAPLMALLEPPAGVLQTIETLERALSLIDAWWRGDPLPASAPAERVEALWVEGGEVVSGEVEGGFAGLYRRPGRSFGVLVVEAPGGTVAYTVGKASEFVRFDVRRFLARCNELEPGWGGGSTIGGAPRCSDGTRSRLGRAVIEQILLDVSRG